MRCCNYAPLLQHHRLLLEKACGLRHTHGALHLPLRRSHGALPLPLRRSHGVPPLPLSGAVCRLCLHLQKPNTTSCMRFLRLSLCLHSTRFVWIVEYIAIILRDAIAYRRISPCNTRPGHSEIITQERCRERGTEGLNTHQRPRHLMIEGK